jgi:hypothetical protein
MLIPFRNRLRTPWAGFHWARPRLSALPVESTIYFVSGVKGNHQSEDENVTKSASNMWDNPYI